MWGGGGMCEHAGSSFMGKEATPASGAPMVVKQMKENSQVCVFPTLVLTSPIEACVLSVILLLFTHVGQGFFKEEIKHCDSLTFTVLLMRFGFSPYIFSG